MKFCSSSKFQSPRCSYLNTACPIRITFVSASRWPRSRSSSAARPATLLISEDYWTSTLSARLRAAMAPHIADILRQGLSVVLDFPANTVCQRAWMKSLIAEEGVPHELHHLDVPDAICKQRLFQRDASGEHQFQVSDEEFVQFTSYFVPPRPGEGFNVIVRGP